MRVKKSAIGSVTIFSLLFYKNYLVNCYSRQTRNLGKILPTSFTYARDFSIKGHIAEDISADTEMAHITFRTAGKLATIFQTYGRRILRKLIQRLKISSC